MRQALLRSHLKLSTSQKRNLMLNTWTNLRAIWWQNSLWSKVNATLAKHLSQLVFDMNAEFVVRREWATAILLIHVGFKFCSKCCKLCILPSELKPSRQQSYMTQMTIAFAMGLRGNPPVPIDYVCGECELSLGFGILNIEFPLICKAAAISSVWI